MGSFQDIEFKFAAGNFDQLPADCLPEVVFSGRSNVGKSSLINKLANRKALARVSSKPGKTATINFYSLGSANLVDLPGYGYARVSFSEKKRWAELVEGYFNSQRDIRLVVQIIDIRHKPSEQDMDMINFLYKSGYKFVIVATKSDKLNKSERILRDEALNEELSEYSEVKRIPFSTVSGEGVESLKQLILESIE